MNTPLRILLIGARGRMGQAIARAAGTAADLTISACVDLGDPLDSPVQTCDVAIDFSAPEATEAICRACAAQRRPLVIGTTGHNAAQKQFVRAAAKTIPIVFAANFSLGVNALFALVRQAAALLGKEFEVEIVEMHHRMKKDAPSGTAKRLAEVLQETRGENGPVPMHSLRGGDVVGDHHVVFAGAGERLELIHRAASRETFALGALRAARWVREQPAGLYNMEHVLGLGC